MNKKLIPLMIATSFASLFTVSALSAPVANLKVSGDIKPPTCTVNGATQNDVTFDYGKISPSIIPENTNYTLGRQTENITITCDAETFLTFIPTDTYTSNHASNWKDGIFGLVNKDNTAQEVGGILIRAADISVDGKKGYWGREGESTWGSNILVKDKMTGWTTQNQNQVTASQLKLASGKVFSANLFTGDVGDNSNYAYILSKKTLSTENIDISNGLDFIGEAKLTFNFGI